MAIQKFLTQLIQPAVQKYIIDHAPDDPRTLVLQSKEILGLPSSEIARQIMGRQKAKTKLPLYHNTPFIVYPPKVNLEQSSSELAASFKSNLFSGKLAVDLTGGFGVDTYYLSKRFRHVIFVEPQGSLLEIAKHNHCELGADNLSYHGKDASSFLNSTSEYFDLIYVDPSRRSTGNKKVFRFTDCSPNVIALLPTLLNKSKFILVKASPFIDIQQGLRELESVSKVLIVGFDNECKEVLFIMPKEKTETIIEVIDLKSSEELLSFKHSEESKSEVIFSEPSQFLYEPSAMILKAGAFKLISKNFNLAKLAPNTHLYTSDKNINSFPGKIFKIETFLKSDSKSIKNFLPDLKANITTRNYPLTPTQLKKKLRVKDGGEKFVIGFSSQKKKHLVLASRIK